MQTQGLWPSARGQGLLVPAHCSSLIPFFFCALVLFGGRAREWSFGLLPRARMVLRQKQVMVRAPGLFRWQASTGGGCMHALVLQLFSIKSICLSHSSRGLRAKVTQSVCASVKVHGHQANVIHAFPSTTTTPIGG